MCEIFKVIYLLLIEFIGVALINKIMLVSGTHFYNTPSVYCTVCSPPQVKSPSITIYPPFTLSYLPPHPFPSGDQHTVCVQESSHFFFA